MIPLLIPTVIHLELFTRHLEAELHPLPFPLNTDGRIMVLLGIILIVIVRTCYAFSTSRASDVDPFLGYQYVIVPSYLSQFWGEKKAHTTQCAVLPSRGMHCGEYV